MPEPSTDAELAAAQAVEYGTYIAKEPIDIGNARAFNPGDPVPVGHVERGVVSRDSVEQVQKSTTAPSTAPTTAATPAPNTEG